MAISVPAELSAAATLVQFWNDSINPAVWITIFLVVIVVLNFCGVRFYGEVCTMIILLLALRLTPKCDSLKLYLPP
jgi:amino acid permease